MRKSSLPERGSFITADGSAIRAHPAWTAAENQSPATAAYSDDDTVMTGG